MKEIKNNSQASAYLEKIYNTLNRDFFGGELEFPVITIQSSVRTYGHVTVDRVWKDSEISRYELNLGAEYLNRPIKNVVVTLLHEMTHIYNLMHNIQDTSRNGQYHNKRFKEKAESVGLLISHHEKYGWSTTQPSEELIVYIQKHKWEDIPLFRSSGMPDLAAPPSSGDDSEGDGESASTQKIKKPSSTRKYICPACGQSIRATKVVNIICGDCNAKMLSELDHEDMQKGA